MITIPQGVWLALAVIAGLIGVDTLLGWMLAVKNHTWSWAKAGQFVGTNVLHYLGGGIIAAVMANLHPGLSSLLNPAFYVAAASVSAKFVLGDIAEKVQEVIAQQPQQTKAEGATKQEQATKTEA